MTITPKFDNEFADWFDAHDEDLVCMECEEIARAAYFAGVKAAQQSVNQTAKQSALKVKSSRGEWYPNMDAE